MWSSQGNSYLLYGMAALTEEETECLSHLDDVERHLFYNGNQETYRTKFQAIVQAAKVKLTTINKTVGDPLEMLKRRSQDLAKKQDRDKIKKLRRNILRTRSHNRLCARDEYKELIRRIRVCTEDGKVIVDIHACERGTASIADCIERIFRLYEKGFRSWRDYRM